MKQSWRLAAVLWLCIGVMGFPRCGLLGPDEDRIDSVGSVTLAWDAPTRNADGTPLTDLTGYRVHYGGTSPLTLENSTAIDVGDVTTYTVSGLEPGTYHFAVSALDANGNTSEFSEEVSTEVPVQ